MSDLAALEATGSIVARLWHATYTLRGRYVYSARPPWWGERTPEGKPAPKWVEPGPGFVAFERRERAHPYQDELQASPRLAEMFRDHGVNHICEAAGLTAYERDAVLLRGGGLSWGEVAVRFAMSGHPIDRASVRTHYRRGKEKLVHTYGFLNGGMR